MKRTALFLFLHAFIAVSIIAAQNPDHSAYYSATISSDQNGNVFVTPAAEGTGWDDGDDWAIGTYRPVSLPAQNASHSRADRLRRDNENGKASEEVVHA